MRLQSLGIALVAMLGLTAEVPTFAQPRQSSTQLVVTGRVIRVDTPRLFAIRELEGGGRELIVLAPRALSPAVEGATVRVEGTLRRLTVSELQKATASDFAPEQIRARLAGRMVLVARSVIAALQGAPSQEIAPRAEEPAETETPEQPRGGAVPIPTPLTLRASVLVADLDAFAGQPVRVLNARVVGLLGPGAFLVEPATHFLKDMGTRDRIVVLVRDGELSVPAELVVGAVVIVQGVARTLLSVQVTREVPWPARLEPDTVKRLEVRAALLATSVQTAEGTELLNRRQAASFPPQR